ncbi:unnamed protein product [Closterium sp. Naga37s-1]|nr:unnamed protein product [Closterium sp. Naga37s-1]
MWHEARRSEKRVHEMMDAAKKRAERRAYQRARRAGDPTQLLRVAGSKLRLLHHSAIYQSAHLSGLSAEPPFRLNPTSPSPSLRPRTVPSSPLLLFPISPRSTLLPSPLLFPQDLSTRMWCACRLTGR